MVIRPAPISLKKHYAHLNEAKKKSTSTQPTPTADRPVTNVSKINDELYLNSQEEHFEDDMVASDGFPLHNLPRESPFDEYDVAADEQHSGLHIIYEREKGPDFGSDYSKKNPQKSCR